MLWFILICIAIFVLNLIESNKKAKKEGFGSIGGKIVHTLDETTTQINQNINNKVIIEDFINHVAELKNMTNFANIDYEKNDNKWIDNLWSWQKKYSVSIFPISSDNLLSLEVINFFSLDYYFNGNEQITIFPAEICNLKNLKKIVAGSVFDQEYCLFNLTTLPNCISKLENLEELHLQNNSLVSLPSEIGKLKKLKRLKLGGNKLTTLPKEIGELKQLELLTLWRNQIVTLPNEIVNLTNLKGLSFWSNPIEYNNNFTDDQIRWLENLQKNGCEIENLDLDCLYKKEERYRVEFLSENSISSGIFTVHELEEELKKDKIIYTDSINITGCNLYDGLSKKDIELSLKYTIFIENKNSNLFNKSYQVEPKLKEVLKVPVQTNFKNMTTHAKENNNYSKALSSIETQSYEKIRRYCQNLVNDNQADTMQNDFAECGKMYKALMYDALEQFIERLDGEIITLIDWGCGQGIASTLVLDYIREKQLDIKIEKVILIDNDTEYLSRAILHVEVLKQNDIDIITIDVNNTESIKKLNETRTHLSLNLFANDTMPLDYLYIDFSIFENAYFICFSNESDKKISEFFEGVSAFVDIDEILTNRETKVGKFKKFEKIFNFLW